MEPTLEEKIKITNATSHLEGVKRNIRTANEELSNILKDKTKLELEISENKTELAQIKDDKSTTYESLKNLRGLFERTEKISEATLEDLRYNIANAIQRKTSLEKEERVLTENISKSKIHLSNINQAIEDIREDIIKDGLEAIRVEAQLEEKQKELINLENKIALKKEEYAIARKNLEQFNLEASKLMDEAIAKIEAEKAKIYNPMKALKEEEAKLNKKRRNIDILEVRMRDRIKAVFPQQNVKI